MQMLSVIIEGKQLFTGNEISERSSHLSMTERNSANAEIEYNTMLAALWASDNIGKMFRNCTVVDMGKYDVDVLTPEGFRMKVPYSEEGFNRQYTKVGQQVDVVSIDEVSIYPAKVIGCKGKKLYNNKGYEREFC